jgi:general secretion pathway protein E/type IV pilus assembly protein PilB
MGVEPFLVSSTVEGVLAQRLVRRLCPECRRPTRPTAKNVPEDFPLAEVLEKRIRVYIPQGCPACRQTGYRGRMGIYEMLLANDRVRALANERQPTNIIKQAAMEAGMHTLRQDGWDKVLQGVTSVEEVLRVTKED